MPDPEEIGAKILGEKMMKALECTSHHFGSDGRCTICQIRLTYLQDALATLNRWTKAEKADPNEHWQEKYDNLAKCKPHTHEKLNPMHKLYDMEGNQNE